MEVFVARQPIFNRSEQVVGYELLFRSSFTNYFDYPDSDQASLKVIADSFFLLGLETITRGKPAFVNFTRDTLVRGYAGVLPRESIVVEILENVPADDEVVAACRMLKESGYKLALDNYLLRDARSPLVELADYVKVDFSAGGKEERAAIARQLAPRGIQLLAAKIETDDEFGEAIMHGYALLQGYFFCRPVVVSGRDVPGFKFNYLKLLQEINRPSLNLAQVEDIVKREVSLSYKLLRYINSVAFGLRHKVTSVRQALLLLGEQGVKKWVSVVILADLGMDRPPEVVVSSVLRARFCEALAPKARLASRQQDLFLLGLFSMIDVIVGRPLANILADLPVADDVKAALLGTPGGLRPVFDLVLAYDRGDWPEVARLTALLGVAEDELPEMYRGAVEWGSYATPAAS